MFHILEPKMDLNGPPPFKPIDYFRAIDIYGDL